jgi:acyl-CoA thioesterase
MPSRPPIDLAAAQEAFDRAIAVPEEEFGNFFLARLLGFEIDFPDAACEVKFTVHDFMYNPQGTLHGGMLTTALDVSMGHLLHRTVGPGATLEFKVQFLAAVRTGAVTCRAQILRQGRSICFLRSEAFNAEGEAVAFATSTWSLIRPKPDAA